MDPLRDAFKRIKEEINSLREDLGLFKNKVVENTNKINSTADILNKLVLVIESLDLQVKNLNLIRQTDTSTDRQTEKPFFSTISTHNSTHKAPFSPLNTQNNPFSTRNEGVSTDRQTDTSTDRQTQIFPQNSMKKALDFLNSLDSVKKEIRLKFKQITDQEFLVFSTIYHLDEEYGGTDYKELAKKLNLTESSIRDYIGRLVKKSIPIQKKKINNKTIQLSISEDLKKIASLSTILQLRDI